MSALSWAIFISATFKCKYNESSNNSQMKWNTLGFNQVYYRPSWRQTNSIRAL